MSVQPDFHDGVNKGVAPVTYGAGGSTRDRTLETVLEIQGNGHQAAPHISCIASTVTRTPRWE